MHAPKSPCFLSLRGATFRLGDRLLFERTDWTFRAQEHWGVLGPNGGGKSLFADCIRGRLPLVGGELAFGFRPPRGLSCEESMAYVSFDERRRTIGDTVVQSRWNSLEEEGGLTVLDYLAYERVMEINPYEVREAHNHTTKSYERTQQRIIRLFHLASLRTRNLLSLSNGERQRVELARALCKPVRLLILDEPFAGLDIGARQQLAAILERLMCGRLRVMLITTREEDLPTGIHNLMWIDDCRIRRVTRRAQFAAERPAARPDRKSSRVTAGEDGLNPVAVDAASPGGKLVELSEVTIRYGAKTILHKLSWTIRQFESWALLGPNGSGKSTLLSLISGDNPQSYANKVCVLGRRRGSGESIWDLKQEIGCLSPELHVHFDLQSTCLAAVESGFFESNGLYDEALPWHRRAAKDWLSRLGLLAHAGKPLCELSTGLQRMVLLARALVKRPALLALDEPCQGLDREHRELLIRTVDELIKKRATTVVYVTHRADEIPASINRVLSLKS